MVVFFVKDFLALLFNNSSKIWKRLFKSCYYQSIWNAILIKIWQYVAERKSSDISSKDNACCSFFKNNSFDSDRQRMTNQIS